MPLAETGNSYSVGTADAMDKTDPTIESLPPRLEFEALKALWSLGEATVAGVRAELKSAKPLAYTTVLTLLDRLANRGAVSRRKKGRAYVYTPALTRQAALDMALDRLVGDFFSESREELVAYLQDQSAAKPRQRSGSSGKQLDSELL